jgi:CheY-like chemotaxis protein
LVGSRHPGSLRVLLVDDQFTQRKLHADLLVRVGIETETAASRDEAVDLVRSSKFDVAVIDYVLSSKYTGLELGQELKHIDNDIVFVILTSSDDAEICRKCFLGGAADFLQKRTNGSEFVQTILRAAGVGGANKIDAQSVLIDDLVRRWPTMRYDDAFKEFNTYYFNELSRICGNDVDTMAKVSERAKSTIYRALNRCGAVQDGKKGTP